MAASQHRRDVCIDALRGLCLVWMTFDHVPWNPLFPVSYEMLGFFSCAEAFVFLSGLVAGWVYTRVADREGTRAVCAKVLRRLALVYGAYALYCTLSLVSRLRSGAPDAWPVFAERMLLWREAGILPLYLVLLAATPLLIVALRAGRMRAVIAGSALLWIAAPTSAARALNAADSDFHRLAWQLLFVLGVCAGFRRHRDGLFLPPALGRHVVLPAAAAAGLLLLRHSGWFDAAWRRTSDVSGLADLGPLRLASFLLAIALIGAVPKAARSKMEQAPWTAALAVLGRRSLYVYVFGWVALSLPWAQAPWWRTAPLAVQLAGAAAVIASLWAAVALRDRLVALRRPGESSLIPSPATNRAETASL